MESRFNGPSSVLFIIQLPHLGTPYHRQGYHVLEGLGCHVLALHEETTEARHVFLRVQLEYLGPLHTRIDTRCQSALQHIPGAVLLPDQRPVC